MMHKVCIHFWRISDDGRRGQCKLCGLIRIFPDYLKLTAVERRAMNQQAHLEVLEARQMTK